MMDNETLLNKIEAFCDRHFIEVTTLGVQALSDGNFVSDVRRGRKPLRRTIKRLLDYMAVEDRKIRKRA